MVGGAEVYGLLGRVGFLSRGDNDVKRFSLIPLDVVFVTVGNVDLLVSGFPEVLIAGGGGKLVPSLCFVRIIVQRQHSAVVNGDKDVNC